MTGSGKTGFVTVRIEEAARAGAFGTAGEEHVEAKLGDILELALERDTALGEVAANTIERREQPELLGTRSAENPSPTCLAPFGTEIARALITLQIAGESAGFLLHSVTPPNHPGAF